MTVVRPLAKGSAATGRSVPVMVPAVSEAQAAGKGVKASARLPVRADESPWTRRELDGVRAELVADLARLGDEVATLQNSIDDVLRDTGDGVGDDQADSGAKAFEREQEMALLATARERQFQTERALHRISDGSYGSCGSCGVPIGKLRLQAFPRASLCVSCKQQEERR